MKKSIIRYTLVAILTLGLTIPSVASASFFSWGCRYQGTWFGVEGPEDTTPAGWMVTIGGRSHWYGTNNLALTADAFDPRLVNPNAVQMTTTRGNWMRVGYNTLMYTTTGLALGADGKMLYIAKVNGIVKFSEDCNSIRITDNIIEIYPPDADPFTADPIGEIPGQEFFGNRAYVDVS